MTILKITEPAREREISVDSLLKAISLKCSNCYAAMAFANSLGGLRTDAWYLCHAYKLSELIDEAKKRGLDLSGLKTSVDEAPVVDSLYYKRATGALTEEQFKTEFRKWQKGG